MADFEKLRADFEAWRKDGTRHLANLLSEKADVEIRIREIEMMLSVLPEAPEPPPGEQAEAAPVSP